MEHKVTRSTYLAQAVSRYSNPPILSVLVLLIIACTRADNVRELVSWVTVILLFFVLIPSVYVFLRIRSSGNRVKSVVKLTTFLKQHPGDIFILGLLSGLTCVAILSILKVPTTLISTVVALLAVSMVTALFNTFYRVSFHAAGITMLIIMAAQDWGPIFLVLLAVLPLIFWAKYHLREHTIPQLVIGIAVAMVVGLVTLFLFGQLAVF